MTQKLQPLPKELLTLKDEKAFPLSEQVRQVLLKDVTLTRTISRYQSPLPSVQHQTVPEETTRTQVELARADSHETHYRNKLHVLFLKFRTRLNGAMPKEKNALFKSPVDRAKEGLLWFKWKHGQIKEPPRAGRQFKHTNTKRRIDMEFAVELVTLFRDAFRNSLRLYRKEQGRLKRGEGEDRPASPERAAVEHTKNWLRDIVQHKLIGGTAPPDAPSPGSAETITVGPHRIELFRDAKMKAPRYLHWLLNGSNTHKDFQAIPRNIKKGLDALVNSSDSSNRQPLMAAVGFVAEITGVSIPKLFSKAKGPDKDPFLKSLKTK